MGHFIAMHGYLAGAVGMWIFAALVSTMPPLDPNAGYGLRWAYGFLHTLAANLDKLKDAIKPPIK